MIPQSVIIPTDLVSSPSISHPRQWVDSRWMNFLCSTLLHLLLLRRLSLLHHPPIGNLQHHRIHQFPHHHHLAAIIQYSVRLVFPLPLPLPLHLESILTHIPPPPPLSPCPSHHPWHWILLDRYYIFVYSSPSSSAVMSSSSSTCSWFIRASGSLHTHNTRFWHWWSISWLEWGIISSILARIHDHGIDGHQYPHRISWSEDIICSMLDSMLIFELTTVWALPSLLFPSASRYSIDYLPFWFFAIELVANILS